jgi:FkbM family methyltransferase
VGGKEDFAAHEVRVFTLLAKAGFSPATIFDIGAGNATWSAFIAGLFPQAAFHLFEPLAKLYAGFAQLLEFQMRHHPSFVLHEVALGAKCKAVTMRIHSDGFSSTTLDMGKHPEYQTRRSVPQFTLDRYVHDHGLALPDVIKLDVQGSEVAVLSQAKRCLERAEVVFAETWFTRGYGRQTPADNRVGGTPGSP